MLTSDRKLSMAMFGFIVIALIGICLEKVHSTPVEIVHKGEKLEIFDCKKVVGAIVKKTIKTFGVCTKEVKANSTKEEFEKKMSCIIKCTLGKMHLLTDTGVVSKETIQAFMDEYIPEDAHAFGHLLVEDCLADYGEKLDTNQPYCETYGEFTQCMQNVIGDVADKANCNIGSIG